MNARYSVIYNRKGKLNSQGKALIQVRVHFNQTTSKYISTEIYIAPEHWNNKKKCVDESHPAAYELNKQIRMLISDIQDFENEQIKFNEPFNKEVLETYLRGKFMREEMTFNKFYRQEMEKLVNHEQSTYSTWKQTLGKLNDFKPHIRFKDINYGLVSDFDSFLAMSGARSVNSRWKHHKNIKKFLNIAIAKGYYNLEDYPYESNAPGGKIGRFKVTREDGEKIPLDFEEVQRLCELDYPDHPHLERTLDVYLFMCYTGLRISDATSVELFRYLHHSSKGYSIDLKRMKKLRRQVYLELYTLFEGKPERIIRKYLKKEFGTDSPDVLNKKDDHFIFGNADKDRFNRYLKLIAHDAKINKNLSAHTARHTFGTQMAVLTNGNINIVMDLMGISKYETAKVYIKLADRMVNRPLRKVNWKEFETGAGEKAIPPTVNRSEEAAPQDSTAKVEQLLDYIYEHVLKSIDISGGKKIPIAIDGDSLKSYAEKLPFSQEYIKSLQNHPYEMNGFVFGMEYAGYMEKIQNKINRHPWFKTTFLKLKLMMMPFDDNKYRKAFV